MGIGRKLMEALLDIADNWLMLTRIELGVLEGNDGAKRLYESLGFKEEGIKKMAVIRSGTYVDEIMMGRIHIPPQLRNTVD
jgi:putative acetyltransferase